MSEALENEILSPKMERAFGIGDPLKKSKCLFLEKRPMKHSFSMKCIFPPLQNQINIKPLKLILVIYKKISAKQFCWLSSC